MPPHVSALQHSHPINTSNSPRVREESQQVKYTHDRHDMMIINQLTDSPPGPPIAVCLPTPHRQSSASPHAAPALIHPSIQLGLCPLLLSPVHTHRPAPMCAAPSEPPPPPLSVCLSVCLASSSRRRFPADRMCPYTREAKLFMCSQCHSPQHTTTTSPLAADAAGMHHCPASLSMRRMNVCMSVSGLPGIPFTVVCVSHPPPT